MKRIGIDVFLIDGTVTRNCYVPSLTLAKDEHFITVYRDDRVIFYPIDEVKRMEMYEVPE